jgi:chemotaxis protein CheZ
MSTDMTQQTELAREWGDLFGALSAAVATGNRAAFLETLDRLGEAREQDLYRELRELSGSLRFALDQFRLDSRLATLAGKDVPDARVRLDHALKLTEDGAHRTLDLVERSCPLAEHTAKQSAAIVASLRAARSTTSDPAAVEAALTQVDRFLVVAQFNSDTVRANLTEVLMAQSYQDLSGQIIRGVITLVGEVERTLTHFAALAGEHRGRTGEAGAAGAGSAAAAESAAASAGSAPGGSSSSARGFGPVVPGLTQGAVGEQGDVDALLADLGM